MPRKIIITGEGGQGIQLISKIITKSAQKSGKSVSYLPSFGVEQRGGVSISYIQIGNNQITYPRFSQADIITIFCSRAVEAIIDFITDETLVIYDNSAIENKYLHKIIDRVKNYVAIPAQKIAKEKYSIKALNMILLGSMMPHLKEINFNDVEKAIEHELASKIAKNPELKDLNLNALKEGASIAENFDMKNQPFAGIDEPKIERTFGIEGKKWTRFPEYCKGCGLCLAKCPVQALTFSKDVGFLGNPLPIVDINKCIACGTCQKICPDGAIKVEKNK